MECLKTVSAFAMSTWLLLPVGSRQPTPRQVRWSTHVLLKLFVQICFVTLTWHRVQQFRHDYVADTI